MLCFNTTMANSNSPKFQSAMTALIRTGMVVKERHRHAYSLTPDGFTLSMSAWRRVDVGQRRVDVGLSAASIS